MCIVTNRLESVASASRTMSLISRCRATTSAGLPTSTGFEAGTTGLGRSAQASASTSRFSRSRTLVR